MSPFPLPLGRTPGAQFLAALMGVEYLISCKLCIKAPLCVRLHKHNTKRSKHWFYMESFIYKLSQRALQTMNLKLVVQWWCKQKWQPFSARQSLTQRPPWNVTKYISSPVFLRKTQCAHTTPAVSHRTPLTLNIRTVKIPYLKDWYNNLYRNIPKGNTWCAIYTNLSGVRLPGPLIAAG